MKTTTNTIKVTGLLGKPKLISDKVADVIIYCEDRKTAVRIRGYGLGAYPQYTPVVVEAKMGADGAYWVKDLRLCHVKTPEYKAFLRKVGHGKAGLKELMFEVYEIIDDCWTEGEDGEEYFYPARQTISKELAEYLAWGACDELIALADISTIIYDAEVLRKSLTE